MTDTKMQYAALVACALLVIPAAAFADNGSNQQNQVSEQQSYLNAVLARATCQANYETGFISTVISNIKNIDQTTVSSDSSKISSDLQTLTADVSSNNNVQFKTDLQSFRTDSKTAMIDLHSAVKNAKPTDDEKTKLKSDFKSLESTYKNCIFTVFQQLANARIQAYGAQVQKVHNETNNLQSRGVDTTHLNQIVSQAQTNLGNLAGAVSSATNSSQLKSAMQSYCQYNGCKGGANFHFAAQSVLAMEQAALDKIKSNPNSGQYSNQIGQAQTDLTNAQNTLNTVGTGNYQGTQQTDIWNALHDAHDIIKQLWGELNGHDHKNGSTSHPGSSSSMG